MEGGPEPVFQRFLVVFFRIVLFFYQDPKWVSTREVFCGLCVAMADSISRWVRFKDSGSANFGPISSKLERSVAFVISVVVAESVAAGAPCGRSFVPFCGRGWTIMLPV